ncbi:hypothetical protein BKE38_11235 [Pseudoroseomonas deserti]|uniref:Uncharacterized protein n=1 Tax=Teichococcus deserti TaxID=1817963 RepID=A0A1V2H2P8_9PROT|nr:hypothetical protein [Pseudoroseomonas deserti]ONG54041.1 hypothetical protein BKE38_11235 [Pseudoroseomonas deserti]
MRLMTKTLAATLMAALLGVAGVAAAPAAQAAMANVLALPAATSDAGAAQEVRYVNRCRRVMVTRRDRYGRQVRVPREVCQRVWVGPRRGPPPRHRS